MANLSFGRMVPEPRRQSVVTTLVAKDRVLAHNPVGALQFADTYYGRVWGPGKPDKLPTKPVEGRKRA